MGPPPEQSAKSEMPRGRHELLWAYAMAFGTLWGAMEVTLGSFLHALRIPFSGPLLAAAGAALLSAQRAFCPLRGVSLATGLVAALLKGFSPAGAILGPMVAIAVEGLLVEIAFLPWPRSRFGAAVAGALVVVWSLGQTFLLQSLLFGASILDIYARLVEEAARSVGLTGRHGWIALSAVAAGLAIGGAALSFHGWRVGRRVAARPKCLSLTTEEAS